MPLNQSYTGKIINDHSNKNKLKIILFLPYLKYERKYKSIDYIVNMLNSGT